jgi:hypothetical protein
VRLLETARKIMGDLVPHSEVLVELVWLPSSAAAAEPVVKRQEWSAITISKSRFDGKRCVLLDSSKLLQCVTLAGSNQRNRTGCIPWTRPKLKGLLLLEASLEVEPAAFEPPED